MYKILSCYFQLDDDDPFIIYPDPTDHRINWSGKDKVWIDIGMVKFVKDGSGKTVRYRLGDSQVNGVLFEKL